MPGCSQAASGGADGPDGGRLDGGALGSADADTLPDGSTAGAGVGEAPAAVDRGDPDSRPSAATTVSVTTAMAMLPAAAAPERRGGPPAQNAGGGGPGAGGGRPGGTGGGGAGAPRGARPHRNAMDERLVPPHRHRALTTESLDRLSASDNRQCRAIR